MTPAAVLFPEVDRRLAALWLLCAGLTRYLEFAVLTTEPVAGFVWNINEGEI